MAVVNSARDLAIQSPWSPVSGIAPLTSGAVLRHRLSTLCRGTMQHHIKPRGPQLRSYVGAVMSRCCGA